MLKRIRYMTEALNAFVNHLREARAEWRAFQQELSADDDAEAAGKIGAVSAELSKAAEHQQEVVRTTEGEL